MFDVCISHPAENGKPQVSLISHVSTVGELMPFFISSSESLQKIGRIVGYCHDIPKATESFQSYLRGEVDDSHNHAPSAAVLTLGAAVAHPYEFSDEEILLAYSTVCSSFRYS